MYTLSLLIVLASHFANSYRYVRLLTALWVVSICCMSSWLLPLSRYAFQQIRSLSLPIPPALGLFTILLPLITGISTRGAYGLIKRASKKEDYLLTIPLIGVLGFQLIYETVIATLAIGYIVPPSALACDLDQKWLLLYREKDEKAIRAIQDRFNCCGLNSVFDRAFPFSGGRSECSRVFGRDKSCFGEWRQAEQLSAGLFLLVALVVFMIKVPPPSALPHAVPALTSRVHPRFCRSSPC